MNKINESQANELMKLESEYLIEGGSCAYGGCSVNVIRYGGDAVVLVFNDDYKTTYYSLTDDEVNEASDNLDRSGFYDIAYNDGSRQKHILKYFRLI